MHRPARCGGGTLKESLFPWLQRWGWALAVVGCYFAFIDVGLNEPDEGRYAEIGREMAMPGGDWFTPHLNGIPHFQKPPLLYWLTALSLKVFGIHEWAARLPIVLAALGTLALTAWLARMLLGAGMQRAAVLVLAATGGFYALARVLTPDMLLTFWITAAIACVVRRYQSDGAGWGVAFFLAMGMGFMTKGPMALVVPLCAALGLRWGTPRLERPRLPWVLGLAATLTLGLWWFVAHSLADKQLLEYFAGDELVARFASSKHGRSKPWWFFLVVLPVAFLPWTAFLPSLAYRLWQNVRQQVAIGPRAGLLLGWVGPPFVILSLSGSKLPTYILPLLPALALGVVSWWRAQGQPPAPKLRIAAGMLALLVVLAGFRDMATPLLKQQAATKGLADLVRAQPDFHKATLFAARVRAQGFTFASGQLVSVAKDEADVVLKPTHEQSARLFKNVAALEKAMSALPVAYGITRRGDVKKSFPAERWRELGSAGDFVLIGRTQTVVDAASNRPEMGK
ncbi:MAG: ArnT family glycosyltransferase [Prosthecobacter sp.]